MEGKNNNKETDNKEPDKKETDKKETDKDKTEKPCSNTNDCPARSLAKFITDNDPAKKIKEKIEQKAQKTADNLKQNVKALFGNPVECAAKVGVGIPALAANTVGAFFKAFTDGMDNVANSFNKMGEAAANGMLDKETGLPKIFLPFEYAFAKTFNDVQTNIGNSLFGEKEWKAMLDDPNLDMEEPLKNVLKTSELLKKISNDDKVKEIFNKWILSYADIIDNAIRVGKVPIERVQAQLTGIIDDTSNKIGNSITNSLSNVISSALKSIPVVGIIFNASDVAMKIAGKIMTICEPSVSKGGFALAQLWNTATNQKNQAKCKINEIKNKIVPIFDKFKKAENKAAEAAGGAKVSNAKVGGAKVGGGAKVSIKRQIKKTTKRVHRLFRLLTRKHMRTPNYNRHIKIRHL